MNAEAKSASWHVAFEGPIAAGKTTLAKLFANETGARTLLERFETNEFLPDFYATPERWALPMQLEFLISRQRQFATCQLSGTTIVADHTFAKDRLFARLLLKGRELALYERVYASLFMPSAEPDLIVFLDAPEHVLLERIRLRARAYEQRISVEYLQELRRAYEHDMLKTTRSRVTRVDTAAFDLADVQALHALYDGIASELPAPAAT